MNCILLQGKSYYFVMMNNSYPNNETIGYHWIEFLPDHVYCFLPSTMPSTGKVRRYTSMPLFIQKFQYAHEITEVRVNQ